MAKTFKKEALESGRVHVIAFTPKGKIWKNYLFQNDERAENWIKSVKDSEAAVVARRAAKVEAKRKAMATLVNPFKVGQVLYNSWGYDQTNVDWYEIVAVGPKSVTLREIKANVVEKGFMCGDSTPLPGEFVENAAPIVKKLQVSVNYDGTVYGPYIKAEHGSFSLSDGKSSHYVSWYA